MNSFHWFLSLAGSAILVAAIVCGSMAQPPRTLADPHRVYTEAEAWRIGWPMMQGPTGNFLTLRTGARLVDDLLQARLVWESEDNDFGSAKTGSQTFRSAADIERRLGPEASVRPGSWAPVIVAEGKVFGASFRPAGKVYQAKMGEETFRFRLDAEDVLIALDAATGKRLWKAIEPGGMVVAGGKRGGFQVAPVYYQGKVFSMGSTGRLFAYDARSGRRLWQSDIGPVHEALAREREAVLAAAEQGQWQNPGGPGWHTSLVVADGVLIVPTFQSPRSSRDINLRGVDPATGRTLWEVEGAVSRWATPSVWPHGEREYLLSAGLAGQLLLIDPRDGKVLWQVSGLGPNYSTLAPSAEYVLVNVVPADPQAKRTPGLLGAYRITPGSAKLAWKMPQKPQYEISTWFDNCARQRCLIRDGRVYVATVGSEQAPGRFVLLDEKTGRILAEHENVGRDLDRIREMYYLVEDRLLVRSDHSHGPTHGGRHPMFFWSVQPGRIARIDDERGPSGLDLVDFASAYEVLMETPIVAGRIFERTVRGTVVCCDLRMPDLESTWSLELDGGYVGVGPLPVQLWVLRGGGVLGGKTWLPTDREAGLPYGMARRFAQWERVDAGDARVRGDRLRGTVEIGFGSHRWPVQLDLIRADGQVQGTWMRQVAEMVPRVRTSGAVQGSGPLADRAFPTPWLADQPWTRFGKNPAGTATYVVQLVEAVPLGKKPATLTLCLDHDGQRFVRAAAAAFGFTQAWHEVDAGSLHLEEGRLTGTVPVVLNADWWYAPHPTAGTGIAATIDVDATIDAKEQTLAGRYEAELGVPWAAAGAVAGRVVAGQP